MRSITDFFVVFCIAASISSWTAFGQDSVVVFNEIMYHPAENEAQGEWIELHNQLVVDVDLSDWTITGGIDYKFPNGTVIPAEGYLVIAISPETLQSSAGLSEVYGPFTGRLGNSDEQIRLRNNSRRIMDEIHYDDGGDWPVAPDGSGVCLAKIRPDSASGPAENWTWSLQVGGTPGKVNFVTEDFTPVETRLISTFDQWSYNDKGQEPDPDWRQTGYQETGDWQQNLAGFYIGSGSTPGRRVTVDTLYSTGLDNDRTALTPGEEDPHYINEATGLPVLVMQNHSAWLSNSSDSLWVGITAQGTDNVEAGQYIFSTTFDLTGYDAATAEISLMIGVDNTLNDIRVNGITTGISTSGFASLNGPFKIDSGFIPGSNKIEFIFTNEGSSANPMGFRLEAEATAVPDLEQTELTSDINTCYFRKQFFFEPDPTSFVTLKLDSIIDDGAVFYLNGTEVNRSNMPQGTIGYSTNALYEAENPEFTGNLTIPSAGLVNGLNTLAIEVHKAQDSDDMLFAANLTAIETPVPATEAPKLAFNEITSASAAPLSVELYNYGDKSIDMSGLTLVCTGITDGEYIFVPQSIGAGQYIVIDESDLGFHPGDEDKLFLYSSDKNIVIDAAVVKNSHRGRYPDGQGQWSYPDIHTPGYGNSFSFHEEIVINEIMYHYRPVPESQAENEITTLISSFSTAAVLVPADDSLGNTWTGADESFDDSSWTDGVGNTTGVGYETTAADFAGLIGTDLISEMYQINTSVYIRIPFDLDDPDTIETLVLLMKYDDGFVAYLNGVEVESENAPGRDGNTQPLLWNSHSTASHADSEAKIFRTFDITQYKQHLRTGENILAIHGLNWSTGSTDMLILPELQAVKTLKPYIPFHENDQEWIELYNRSSYPVNLTGWKIRGGIEFDFPNDTFIPAGDFLVVAKYAGLLQNQYPSINVIGDFEGSLSNRDDKIFLIDENKNSADRVHYYDRGYWDEYSDAGGSSLELRNPFTDNSVPSAWSASDETSRSSWKAYAYQMTASPAPGSNEPANWHEFILGLLDAGEILVDNVSVIEDPDGSAIQLIQAGSFEYAANTWRLLGNHGLGAIIAEPGNTSNHVLHLVASGPTEHMHNHIETTFADSETINNGTEYKISFRAKWLKGSNQLNTRLYFNRSAKTTLLDVPQQAGTPGRINSVYILNAGPALSGLQHTPAVPESGQDIAVSIRAEDIDGIEDLNLYYSADGGEFVSVEMYSDNNGRYEGSISGLASGTIVQFYVVARDKLDNYSVWPPAGTDSSALFRVDDGQAFGRASHDFRIVMTGEDAEFLHTPTNVMSNHRTGATVIYKERDIYYDVGLHLKGSGYGRNSTRGGFNIRFRPDQMFQGVHDIVSIDRNGGPGGEGASQRELVVKHFANRAGDIPSMYDDVINLISPRNDRNGPAQLLLARYDDTFLASQYENGNNGTLYEFELIYSSQNTVDGDPQSLKLPPSTVRAIDFTNMGDDKEAYRWNYLIKNNRSADDYSDIISMAQTFSLSGSAFADTINNHIDVDQWMRVFAFESLAGIGDTYNQGLAHNIMLYVNPEDNRILALPWDMDFAFYQSTSASIFGGGSKVQNVITIERYKRLFYGHLQDIINTCFSNDYLSDWIDHYALASGQNVSSDIKSRIDARRNYVLQQLPVEVAFKITTNAGQPFTVDTDNIVLNGNGWINVRKIRIAGNPEPLDVTWTDIESWSVTIPLEFGENQMTLEAYDYRNDLIASDSITVTSISTARPLRQYLRVTELMYDPAGGKEYEFIELCNTGSQDLDITDTSITGGIEFFFSSSAVTGLQPGQYVVVVKDQAAFESRYGSNLNIAGQYTGSLDNGGEDINIRAQFNAPVLAFEYNDSRSWPLAADGGGHSLVPLLSAINDESNGSLNYGGNWRASTYINGSPGKADPQLPAGIVLNEIMAHTDYYIPPHESNDWIELYNNSGAAVQLNGSWYLSDDMEALDKWPLPSVIVQPYSSIAFDEVSGFHNPITTGFGLNKAGDEVFLSYLPGTDENRIVDGIRFKGQENSISLGRLPNGNGFWHKLEPTRDTLNTTPLKSIVISEIKFNTDQPDKQYIEIYNSTDTQIFLENSEGSWRINGDIEYTFDTGISLKPFHRLLVAGFDPVAQPEILDTFKTEFGIDTADPGIDIVGPFQGSLDSVTGRIAVEKPQAPDVLGESVSWIIVDEVIYFNDKPWPIISSSGEVLQRKQSMLCGNDPYQWRSCPATPLAKSIAPADFNIDGNVDMQDIASFANAWLTESGQNGFNDKYDIAYPPDGTIELNDLESLTSQWLWFYYQVP